MVARRMFGDDYQGFYVDVGAHHPERYSNTAWFYSRGWRGINIEADPDLTPEIEAQRPRDITLNCAIAQSGGTMTFYRFAEAALNTFDLQTVERYRNEGLEATSTAEVQMRTLTSVIDEVGWDLEIDLLSVDVEGLDMEVLLSNDWTKRRPKVILVESHGRSCDSMSGSPVARLLANEGYVSVAKTLSTAVFATEVFALRLGITSPGRD